MHLLIHQILNLKTLWIIIKNALQRPYSFLVIDATVASANTLRFRDNRLERIQKLILAIDEKIRDEKLQYNINREAAKTSALSSGKIDKYEFLTGEEMLPPDQRKVIEKAKFAYSPLGTAFEKQTKMIEYRGEKQLKAIVDNKSN